MTVKELIEELKNFPDHLDVKIHDDYDSWPTLELELMEYSNEKPYILIRY